MYSDNVAERIKAAVSVGDALSRYHQLGRSKGRTTCPIHGGKRDNLGYNDLTWHCFVCGASGDVISFVMQMFGLDFKTAVAKICEDYRIPTSEQLTPKERKEIAEIIDEKKKKREIERAKKRRNDFNFILSCRYMWWLRKQPESKIVLMQLADMERWTDRMAIGEMVIDYDIKATLKCLRLKITEERNAIKAGSTGNEVGTSSRMDGRGI